MPNQELSRSCLSKRLFLPFFLGFLGLYACSSTGPAPINSRDQPPSKAISSHVVEKGDTLYSIAWLYQKDFKDIAAINRIRAPYNIRIGERLQLYGDPISNPESNSVSTSRSLSERRVVEVSANSASVSTATSAAQPRTTVTVSTTPTPAVTRTASPTVDSASRAAVQTRAPASELPTDVKSWIWPLPGNIVKSFGSTGLMNGITLNSTNDKTVKAAADGVVVYAGSGIRGYGNFLVLKHSEIYLSAYAYNEKLLVNEGDQIHQGQQIAMAGKDLDGKPRLYFEIRKDGKSVDPIRYLPKK